MPEDRWMSAHCELFSKLKRLFIFSNNEISRILFNANNNFKKAFFSQETAF